MGTWGTGFFEDDIALDWLYKLEDGGPPLVVRTLANVGDFSPNTYLEAPEASEALAAAALAAGSLSKRYYDLLPDEGRNWLDTNEFEDQYAVAFHARHALWRILGDNSELKDVWKESDDFGEWHTAVLKLQDFIRQETEELGRGVSDEELEKNHQQLKFIRETENYVVYEGYIKFYEDIWGPGIFEHRDAMEYLCFTEDKSPRALLNKIKSVANFQLDEWLLMTDACEALVGMALLTATDNPGYWISLPPEGRDWLRKYDYKVTDKDRNLCVQCLTRIFRHKSEWLDVWEGAMDYGNARQAVFEMARGLGIMTVDGDVAEGVRFVVFDKPVDGELAKQPVYTPLRRLASFVQVLAWLISVVMLLMLILDLIDMVFVNSSGHSSGQAFRFHDSSVGFTLNWVWTIAYVALWVAFALLIRRAHANLPALAGHVRGSSPLKAMLNILIPWFGWLGHFSAVQDVIRASHPTYDPENPVAWQETCFYWPVFPFWLGWAYLAVVRFGLGMFSYGVSQEYVIMDYSFGSVMSILLIVLMVMVILITRELVRRQSERRLAIEIHAAGLGLSVDDFTVLQLSNVRGFGGRYREHPVPQPAQHRDNLVIEKWVFLVVTVLYGVTLASYFWITDMEHGISLSLNFSVAICGVYLLAAWRVFFAGVRNEKRGCIGLTVLCMIAVLSLLFGFEMYRQPAALAWYSSAFILHVWLLTITVRDARRWRTD